MSNEKLKIVRQLLGLNQKEFAERLGIKQSYYSALELNKKEVTAKLLKVLFEKIGVSNEWWYNSKGNTFSQAAWTEAVGDYTIQPIHSPWEQTLYKFYESLPEKELNFQLSIETEKLKEIYNSYYLLCHFIHQIKSPQFIKDKFQIPPIWSEYKKDLREDFEFDHKHLKGVKVIMAFQITNLYMSNQEHYISSLQSMIHYISQHADFFCDDTLENMK